MRQEALICALVTVVWLLGRAGPAAAETRPRYGGTIIGALLSEPVEIDPTRSQSHADVAIVTAIFDTLYRMDGKDPNGALRIVPHVAKALPEVSENGLMARIPIRAGILFHDSTELGPSDVAGSLERLARSPLGWLVAPVRTVRKEGDAVVLELVRPTPDLAVLLSAPATSITPEGKAPTWQRAVGSGPFKLLRLDTRQRRVILTAANGHFAGRPYVNRLELGWFERSDDEAAAYEAGRSHISLRGSVAYAGHTPKYQTSEAMGPATLLVYVGFGQTREHKGITQSRAFRRALFLALERNGFRGIGTGESVVPTVHPVAVDLDGPVTRESERRARMAEARDALAAAAREAPALKDPVAGRRSTFELELVIDRTRPDDREVAEKVVAALFGLGVSARITSLSAREFGRRVRRGQCDLYIGQLPLPVPLTAHAMAAAFAAGDDAWATRQLGKAGLDMAEATRVFGQRLPMVPLFHRSLRVHHRDNVRGIRFDDAAQLPLGDLFFFGKAKASP